jgi:hypothetical protein
MSQKNRSNKKFFILLGIVMLLMIRGFVFCRGQSRGIIVSADDVLTTLDDDGFKIVYVEPDTLHNYCPRFNETDARLFEFKYLGDQYRACVRVFDDWSYTKELNKEWNQSNRRMDYNWSYSVGNGTIMIDYIPYDHPLILVPNFLIKIHLSLILMFSKFN